MEIILGLSRLGLNRPRVGVEGLHWRPVDVIQTMNGGQDRLYRVLCSVLFYY